MDTLYKQKKNSKLQQLIELKYRILASSNIYLGFLLVFSVV